MVDESTAKLWKHSKAVIHPASQTRSMLRWIPPWVSKAAKRPWIWVFKEWSNVTQYCISPSTKHLNTTVHGHFFCFAYRMCVLIYSGLVLHLQQQAAIRQESQKTPFLHLVRSQNIPQWVLQSPRVSYEPRLLVLSPLVLSIDLNYSTWQCKKYE